MDDAKLVLLLVLCSAGVIGWVWLKYQLGKGLGRLKSKANQAIFLKDEYEDRKRLLRPMRMESSVSPEEIMCAIDQQVMAVAGQPTAAGLYVISRQADSVVYVWGNRFEQAWRVVVKADGTDTGSLVTLTVPKWRERDGLLVSHDVLARLRSQIQAAAGGGTDAGFDAAAPSDSVAADFTPSEGTAWKTPLKNLLLLGMLLLVTRGAYLVVLDRYQSIGERLGNLILYGGGAAACYLIASRIHTYRGDAVGETAGPTGRPSGTAGAVERFSSLGGKTRALLVLGLLAAVLVAGLVVSNYDSAGSSSDGHVATVDVNNPGGTGGDYTPPADPTPAVDSASSASGAGEDGAGPGEDGASSDNAVGAGNAASDSQGNTPQSPSPVGSDSSIDAKLESLLIQGARGVDNYNGDYTVVELHSSGDWAIGGLEQASANQYSNFYAWHRSGETWECKVIGSPTSDYKVASIENATNYRVPQGLISAMRWTFKPSFQGE